MSFKLHSIRVRLLAMIGTALVATAALVVVFSEVHMVKLIDETGALIYTEKINNILNLLAEKNRKLEDTLMVEAYEADFKASAVDTLRRTYYHGSSLRGFPVIFDDDGLLIMHPEFEAGNDRLQTIPHITSAIKQGAGELNYTCVDGTPKWLVFGRFEAWSWTVAFSVPLEAKYATARKFTRMLILTTGGITVLVLTTVFVVVSRVTSPIRELASASREIARGNFDQPLDIRSRDEVGMLAADFAAMRDSIREKLVALSQEITTREAAECELQKHHDRLEELVEDRTKELTSANGALEAQQQELIGINRELERARCAAEESTQAKTAFLANMSHEIRTPMTAILGFTEAMLDPTFDDSERLDAMYTIRRNGEHLLQIINDILDISKIEAGKLEVECIQCSPVQLVADVKSLMQVRASSKNLELSTEFSGAIPETIESDPTRLKQILVNLVSNAIKFTDGGTIRLVTHFVNSDLDQGDGRSCGRMQFDVVDSGIGMTTAQVSKLFQPFEQADVSTSRKFGGTGLGLMISKRLAEMLGGDITVESELGVGSCFQVEVVTGPLDGVRMLEGASAASIESVGPAVPAADGAVDLHARILMAEDGPDNQRLVRHILKKAGAEVVIVENGACAVDAALAACDADMAFDVILMDMQMPIMDGYEATQLLRKQGYTRPIIAMTAHAMASDREKCLEAGCDEYTTKPIDRQRLLEVIQGFLSKSAS